MQLKDRRPENSNSECAFCWSSSHLSSGMIGFLNNEACTLKICDRCMVAFRLVTKTDNWMLIHLMLDGFSSINFLDGVPKWQ